MRYLPIAVLAGLLGVVAAGEPEKTEDAYKQYLEKSKSLYEALLRIDSDLEVGVNYVTYGDRLRDLNLQYNKWRESLTAVERTYLSAKLMTLARESHSSAYECWGLIIKFTSAGASADGIAPAKEIQQSWWKTASVARALAKTSFSQKDHSTEFITCPRCAGMGELTDIRIPPGETKHPKCPVCAGTGEFPASKSRMIKRQEDKVQQAMTMVQKAEGEVKAGQAALNGAQELLKRATEAAAAAGVPTDGSCPECRGKKGKMVTSASLNIQVWQECKKCSATGVLSTPQSVEIRELDTKVKGCGGTLKEAESRLRVYTAEVEQRKAGLERIKQMEGNVTD